MPKSKIVVGIPAYGKSFTLTDALNNGVGAPTSGAGAAGQYTQASGTLSYYEVLLQKPNHYNCIFSFYLQKWSQKMT